VITGKNAGARMVEPRRMTALPGREPMRQFLETAKRARRLGQLPLAYQGRGASLQTGPQQMREQFPDFA
jgi:hypothetical protein